MKVTKKELKDFKKLLCNRTLEEYIADQFYKAQRYLADFIKEDYWVTANIILVQEYVQLLHIAVVFAKNNSKSLDLEEIRDLIRIKEQKSKRAKERTEEKKEV